MRFQKVLSDAQYGLAVSRGEASIRRNLKRASNKARRSLDRLVIEEEQRTYEPILSPMEELDRDIDALREMGAAPYCCCGCGGWVLGRLIDARRRGVTLTELLAIEAKEQLQDEIDDAWENYLR